MNTSKSQVCQLRLHTFCVGSAHCARPNARTDVRNFNPKQRLTSLIFKLRESCLTARQPVVRGQIALDGQLQMPHVTAVPSCCEHALKPRCDAIDYYCTINQSNLDNAALKASQKKRA